MNNGKFVYGVETRRRSAFLIFLCMFFVYIFSEDILAADSGFYADITGQYVYNELDGEAKDRLQGVEPAVNGGFQFMDWLSAGLFTNVSLGTYFISGNLTEHEPGLFYNTDMITKYDIYRFDIQAYVMFSLRPSHAPWVKFSIGIGPEFSIYQYMFQHPVRLRREIVGTQAVSLALMPQIQFTIYDHIIFGFRAQIVPFTFSGRSVYVFYFSNDKSVGYNSFEKEKFDVQNKIFKFGIFAGYFFGKSYYRSNYNYGYDDSH
ncbi:MAG: hypothetical protein LBG74_05280 [Spirochaetaceae bacterium]|nr:hypothetical protein [Spirochaetaceae bacterium]